MNDDIKQWYQDHGLPYLEEDWGDRDENGESIGPQTQQPQRAAGASVRSIGSTPDMMWWWEKQAFPWRERGHEEAQWLALLDDFFAPYLALLPRAKGNLLRQVFGDLATYDEVATIEDLYDRSHARKATQRALRALTRLVANDDPLFRPNPDRRKRDYEEEARAARRVFMVYVNRRQ